MISTLIKLNPLVNLWDLSLFESHFIWSDLVQSDLLSPSFLKKKITSPPSIHLQPSPSVSPLKDLGDTYAQSTLQLNTHIFFEKILSYALGSLQNYLLLPPTLLETLIHSPPPLLQSFMQIPLQNLQLQYILPFTLLLELSILH